MRLYCVESGTKNVLSVENINCYFCIVHKIFKSPPTPNEASL